MQEEEARSRALRGTALGLVNGVSLVFLAVLATAYGSEIALSFTSIDAFLVVATAWVGRPAGTGFAWVLGYLGVFVILASPIWSFIVRPRLWNTGRPGIRKESNETLDEGHAETEPDGTAEDGQVDESGEPVDAIARDQSGSDGETDFVWGDTSEGPKKEFTRDQSDDENGFVWGESPESD